MTVERVTFDELYRRSSQYRLWSFTVAELKAKREAVNKQGSLKVDQRLKALDGQVTPDQIGKVTAEEELKLISFHSRRIGMLAKHFQFSSQVRATAISFLRKFYLVNSVMEYHPKLVLLTCLFLAAKSENQFISIQTFSKRIPKTTPESILKLEFEILQSLKFTLLTHHPYRPLQGFFFDLQTVMKDEFAQNILGRAHDEARKLIDEALITDAVYHFTPPQIALAALRTANEELVTKYLEKKFKKEPKVKVEPTIKEEAEEEENNNDPEVKQEEDKDSEEKNEQEKPKKVDIYEEILKTISECQSMIRNGQNPTKEEATDIDRKSQYCLNPSLILKRKRDDTPSEGDDTKRQRLDTPGTPA